MNERKMPLGKVDPDILEKLVLPSLPTVGERILVGPGVGEDSAVIDMGGLDDALMVVSSDPISGAEEGIGRYAVHVNANDVATSGAKPVFFLTNILLRKTASPKDLGAINSQIARECRILDVSVIGGHTEVSPIERTIVSSTMIGFVKRENLARRPFEKGDLLLLTKGAGIEGTSILSSEMGEKLASLDPVLLERARAYSSMISVVEEAMLAAGEGAKRMHDPTEGGVVGGLRELAEAHCLSLRVEKDKIFVGPETEAICAELDLDPLKLISSGSLLCIVPRGSADRVKRNITGKGIGCKVIGRVEEVGKASLVIESDQGDTRIEEFPTDEIWRMLS